MPYMKVNLNGRKYVISGLTERTSSKHILCSLARVDSSFHLETTDQSDSSVEVEEWKKGVRSSRSRTRHMRVRHSSTSSLEITEWKNCLRGALSEKSALKHVGVINNSKSQEWHVGKCRPNAETCSRKLLFPNPRGERSLESKRECSLRIQETSSEDKTEKQDGKEKEKSEVKKRKRKKKKRPVSQDITSWKDKDNESKESRGKMELGKKGWKSADDVREKKCDEKKDEKMERNQKTKQSRKSRHSHSHTQNTDRYIVIDAIDKPSEYRRVHRHVREELNKLKIQKMVSRAVDERLVDFHVACLQTQNTNPEIQLQNEEETKKKLLLLINSQRKCLSALNKAEKQTKKALNRYKRYLDIDKEKIQFYNANFESENLKIRKERERRTSDTDHDTGISEQHSDSSNENRHTSTFFDVYKHDVRIDYVVSDDVVMDDNSMEIKESEMHDVIADSGINDDVEKSNDTEKIKNSKPSEADKNDVDYVTCDDVIGRDIATDNNELNRQLVVDNGVTNDDVRTCDETFGDDVLNDVNIIEFTNDNESDQDVIIAKQTEIVPFDQSENSSTAIPCWSAGLITASTVSEITDCCSHDNSLDSRDSEELEKVLMEEKERQRNLKHKIDRLCGEMRLMDLRIQEQENMADVLESLKNLNDGLVKDEAESEPGAKSLKNDKKNLRKSIKLSMNLYEYQKGEMNDNALSLQIIESQIKRKRWHVESAVRDLGQFVTSSLRTQLERIQSLEEVAGIKTSVVFNPKLNGTLV